jgi:hypothetical protein
MVSFWLLLTASTFFIPLYLVGSNQVLNNLFLVRGGQSDFTFGKDRELFHASIDLKWLYFTLTNKKTWIRIAENIVDRISKYDGTYDFETKYKEAAIDLIIEIRKYNQNSRLK